MKTLKNYRVFAECITTLYIDVQAGDIDDAKRIAEETDGGDFTECPDAEWNITEAIEEEVKN